jgi:hypothetical protein
MATPRRLSHDNSTTTTSINSRADELSRADRRQSLASRRYQYVFREERSTSVGIFEVPHKLQYMYDSFSLTLSLRAPKTSVRVGLIKVAM